MSGVVLVSSSSLTGSGIDRLADLALWEVELTAGGGPADVLSVARPLVERLRQVPDPPDGVFVPDSGKDARCSPSAEDRLVGFVGSLVSNVVANVVFGLV